MTSPPDKEDTIRCVVILGPTATGKTALGVSLARTFAGEIVSCDSRQVYRGLDIGTGKDLGEYTEGGSTVRHHMIDVVDPTDEFHLFRFVAEAIAAIRDITARRKLPLIVGGTPLYLNALLRGYELEGGEPDADLRRELEHHTTDELIRMLEVDAPDIHARTDLTQRRRIVRALEIARTRTSPKEESASYALLDALLLAPYFERKVVHKRIEARLDERLLHGLIDEVADLQRAGVSWQRLDDLGLEYRYVARFLQGQLSRQEMRDALLAKIRRFCRSQDIWFRKMERQGTVIHWIPGGDGTKARSLVEAFLANRPLPPPELRLKDITYGPKGK